MNQNNEADLSRDQQLWMSFQEGNQDALASIYSIYFDNLYNYGFKFCQDSTLVEDCIQELFIKLIRNRQNLTQPQSVKGYIFKALRLYIFDKLKQAKKLPDQELNDLADFDVQLHPEAVMVANEEAGTRQRLLADALNQLTARQREAIFLKYQEGLTYPQIAETLNLSQKATYKLLARALQAIKACIPSFIIPLCLHWFLES